MIPGKVGQMVTAMMGKRRNEQDEVAYQVGFFELVWGQVGQDWLDLVWG